MGWFGRKSAGPAATPRPPIPAWLADPDGALARSYEAQAREVYRTNPVGFRAVRLVAGAVGGLPVYAETGDPAAAALVGAPGLLERLAAALLMHGNAYCQLIAGSDGAPAELAALRPERVSIAANGRGYPVAYVYRAGSSATRIAARDALERRQVAHVRGLTLADDHYGQGCLDAAIGAASLHNRAAAWNRGLLANAARPSGALVFAPGDGANLSAEQYDRLKEELAAQFSGSANAGRPLLLDGGLSWQPMSLSPAEMDFIALKESAARDIALAFGVPPVLLGLPGDATYANAREAGRALYRQTVLPMARAVLAELSAMLGDWLGPVTLSVDVDQLSELAEDRALLWRQAGEADFISREEKRELLGYGPAEEGQ